jgi:hypothetical protein
MHPVHFPQQNTLLAKDQVEYTALPAFRGSIPHHPVPGRHTEEVISCYRLTDAELEQLCKQRIIWLRQVVAIDGYLQPQLIQVESPFIFENGTEWDGKGNEKENYKKKEELS